MLERIPNDEYKNKIKCISKLIEHLQEMRYVHIDDFRKYTKELYSDSEFIYILNNEILGKTSLSKKGNYITVSKNDKEINCIENKIGSKFLCTMNFNKIMLLTKKTYPRLLTVSFSGDMYAEIIYIKPNQTKIFQESMNFINTNNTLIIGVSSDISVLEDYHKKGLIHDYYWNKGKKEYRKSMEKYDD